MRTIRASEIGTYLYCQRAWRYDLSGESSINIEQLAAGDQLHYQHGRAALGVSCLRALAYFLLLLALVLASIYFTEQLI